MSHWKTLVSKMEGKTNFSRHLKQFGGLTVLTPTPDILRQIFDTGFDTVTYSIRGRQACKRWELVCCLWRYDWSFACLIAPVVTTTSIILGCNKIQYGDILVPGPPGKMAGVTRLSWRWWRSRETLWTRCSRCCFCRPSGTCWWRRWSPAEGRASRRTRTWWARTTCARSSRADCCVSTEWRCHHRTSAPTYSTNVSQTATTCYLYTALAAAQCIVIGPVCGWVSVCVCVFVGLLPR